MQGPKQITNCHYPVYAKHEDKKLDEWQDFLQSKALEDSTKKARLLLNPSYHDATQESLFFAKKTANFSEKKYPFLPWMELEVFSGELTLVQQYPNGKEEILLKPGSPYRFDPSVPFSYQVSAEQCFFKQKSIGPYLENLVVKKIS